MIQEREIRERLASLLFGKLSLAAFGEWLASESWNMFADNSSNDAISLVAAINIRIDAYDERALSRADLERELLGLLNDAVISVQFDENLEAVLRPVPAANAAWFFASPFPDPVEVFAIRGS
jgi:hypothetical protein